MIRELLCCIVCSAVTLFAQADSAGTEDASQTNAQDETLLEQSAEDSPIIDVIVPESHTITARSSVFVRSRLMRKVQQAKGYANGSYLGSPLKSYQRITATLADKFMGGMLVAKDAGEQRVNEFSSWNLSVSDVGIVRNAVIGNYRLETGQGIALWRGYDFSKGADVLTPVNRKPRGLVSSLSTDEIEYFMGAATGISLGPVTATLFYSHRSLSASKDTTGTVTALYNSGYFRTEGEMSKRDDLAERLYGAHVAVHVSERHTIGMTYYQTRFSSPLSFDEGKRFAGDRFPLIAMEYTIGYESLTLFGEWATVNSTVGGVSGIRIDPAEGVVMVLSVRNYPLRFVSLHGLGFGEGSSMSNENGVYLGMRLRLMKPLSLSLYYDQFSFPERRSISRFPAHGNDILGEVHASLPGKCKATFRYQRKTTDASNDLLAFDVQRVQRLRLQVECEVSRTVRLRWRMERVFLDWRNSPQAEKGLMMYQDIGFRPGKHLWWNVRLVLFHTDSYSTRISPYERDLEGVLALPALYGTGLRWYALVRYSLSEEIGLSAKYSDLVRDGVKHLGSGLEELPTNRDTRVGVQMDLRL